MVFMSKTGCFLIWEGRFIYFKYGQPLKIIICRSKGLIWNDDYETNGRPLYVLDTHTHTECAHTSTCDHRQMHVQHIVPLRYARAKRWCSTSPMWATTISKTSLQTALMSQVSSSFWPFSSTTPTFLCTSSTLRFLWSDRTMKGIREC